MRTIHRLPFVFAIAVAVLTGCVQLDLTGALSGPAGRYSLDMDQLAEAFSPLIEAAIAEEVANQPLEERDAAREKLQQEKLDELRRSLEGSEITLVLEADGTWTREQTYGKTSEKFDGIWEQRGDKLLLTTHHKDGQTLTVPKVEEATFKNGEITVHDQSSGFMSVDLVLRRS